MCLGMISVVDSAIANITAALKAKGLWDDALIIFSSDNGELPTSGILWQEVTDAFKVGALTVYSHLERRASQAD